MPKATVVVYGTSGKVWTVCKTRGFGSNAITACLKGAGPGSILQTFLQGLAKGRLEEGLAKKLAIKAGLRDIPFGGFVLGCAGGVIGYYSKTGVFRVAN